jgi:hypothetical protein
LPRGCAAGSSSLLRQAFVAPRAWSGRSGCASSAALRPAFACDRAGTARRPDPRCAPSLHETLGRGQRFHPPVWPLGARTLRPHGSVRPRGGFHRHPPALQQHAQEVLAHGYRRRSLSASSRRAGDQIRRCRGWQVSPEPAGTPRAHRRRETRARCDALGTAMVTGAWRTAGSRAEECAGAAAGETQARTQPLATPAKGRLHAVNKERRMVEAGGIEPPSGRLGPLVSPCAAYGWFSSRRLGVGSRPSRPARTISTAAAGRSGGPACFGGAVIRFAGGSRRSRRGCG